MFKVLIDLGLNIDAILPKAVKQAKVKTKKKKQLYTINLLNREEHANSIYNIETELVKMNIKDYNKIIQLDVLLIEKQDVLFKML